MMDTSDRDTIYTDILTMPERLAHALERIDLDQLPDRELKAFQRRLGLLTGAAQEMATEYRPGRGLEVGD